MAQFAWSVHFGQTTSDHNKWLSKLPFLLNESSFRIWELLNLPKSDYIIRLMTLSVITLSCAHSPLQLLWRPHWHYLIALVLFSGDGLRKVEVSALLDLGKDEPCGQRSEISDDVVYAWKSVKIASNKNHSLFSKSTWLNLNKICNII